MVSEEEQIPRIQADEGRQDEYCAVVFSAAAVSAFSARARRPVDEASVRFEVEDPVPVLTEQREDLYRGLAGALAWIEGIRHVRVRDGDEVPATKHGSSRVTQTRSVLVQAARAHKIAIQVRRIQVPAAVRMLQDDVGHGLHPVQAGRHATPERHHGALLLVVLRPSATPRKITFMSTWIRYH